MEETQMVNLIQQILRKICSVFNTKPSFNSTNLIQNRFYTIQVKLDDGNEITIIDNNYNFRIQ